MPDRRHRPDLLGGFVDGTLDDTGRDELLRQVHDDPHTIDQIRRQALLHGILKATAGQPIDADAVMAKLDAARSPVERAVMGYVMAHPPAQRPPRPVLPPPVLPPASGWRLSWSMAMGWMMAAATAVFFLWVRSPAPAQLHTTVSAPAVDEPASIPLPVTPVAVPSPPRLFAVVTTTSAGVFVLGEKESRPARVGDPVRTGDGLITSAVHGRAVLLLSDGSRIDVSPDTVLARVAAPGPDESGGGRLFLAHGVVQIVRAPASPAATGQLQIDAPHGTVSLVSARARIQISGDGMQVDVNAGHARFVPSGRAAHDLSAGQYALSIGEGSAVRGTRGTRRALLLAGAKILSTSDSLIRSRLEKLKFEVTTFTTATLDLTIAADSSVVVVSSSVSPQDVDPRLRDLPVPILTWEAGLFPILGMTGRCEDDECGFHLLTPFSLDIKDPGHPLAAGQTGVIDLPLTDKMGWGTPNINAAWVATITGHPTRAGIFAYDRGAAMPGAVAPARRVGFFLFDSTVEGITSTAVTWKFFERAVLWCLE